MSKKILLGLTTITAGEWRNKVKEIDRLNLKEIALFPTCLNLAERKELYGLLEKTGLESIPHVHLREEDTETWELDYFLKSYNTRVFNVHALKEADDFINKHQKYKVNIYVENGHELNDSFKKTVKLCGGICLDLSHWESRGFREKNKGYNQLADLLSRFEIGVNHLSAIKLQPLIRRNKLTNQSHNHYDSHWLDELSEVDYVIKYKNYLAEIISIELENSLERQLEVKKYLEKILDL